ncbi:MAG: formylglycine-generating enzyme family protein [Verrucomicrobia bacterium]|nr:formylglycine-generating enzyme family protein [Verrucomicrobiota bacterium]
MARRPGANRGAGPHSVRRPCSLHRMKPLPSLRLAPGSHTRPGSLLLLLPLICALPPATTPAPGAAGPATVPLTNMVAIRAGTFQRIKFPVTLTRDYWIGKFEVTQGEYASVMGRNPSHFTGDSNRPVEKVSFLDAVRYCEALTNRERHAGHLAPGYVYRLPTEAEWEYACRAGSTNRYHFGDEAAAADAYAWTSENSSSATHPVGQKAPNAWGLHDTHGNVWEWCHDWFEPYPARPLTDPVGPATSKYKLFKGGGWNQDADYARASSRFMMSASNGIHFVGFRMVLGMPLPVPSPGRPQNTP